MMKLPANTRVYLSCRTTDMRKGFGGLAAEAQHVLNADPFSGHLFVFRGKRGDYVKILYWDGTGMCLYAKRLEESRFVWPPIVDGGLQINTAQLGMLLEGMDWRRTVIPEAPRVPVYA